MCTPIVVAGQLLTRWRMLWPKPSSSPGESRTRSPATKLTHQWRSASRRGRLAEKLASLGITAISLPEDTVIVGQEHHQVLTALGALKDTDQEILRLTAWEELPQAEIAVVLGISIGAVRQRFYTAKKKLADEYIRIDNRKNRSPAAQKGGVW